MPAAQTVTLFLMDGTPTGRIKCTLSNWIGQVYVLPRTGLAGSTRREELTRSGVYLLTGEDPATGEPTVYVGQVARRANGRGVLGRIIEHKADPAKDYFTRAIAVVAADDSLGQTEITYLENALHGLLKEAGRARVDNDVVPAPGTVTEEKRAELDQFLEFMRLAIGSLGYPLTEPADPGAAQRPRRAKTTAGGRAQASRSFTSRRPAPRGGAGALRRVSSSTAGPSCVGRCGPRRRRRWPGPGSSSPSASTRAGCSPATRCSAPHRRPRRFSRGAPRTD